MPHFYYICMKYRIELTIIHKHTIIMQIGDSIPENLGIDQDGNEIKSSDYRGRKIVLRRVRCVSCRKRQV